MTDDPRKKLTEEQFQAMKVGHQIGQNFITDADFAEEFQQTIVRAKETFEKDGYLAHIFLVHLQNNKTGQPIVEPIMLASWPPPQGKKEEALMGLGVKVAADNPDCTLVSVTHISEGWMAKVKPEELDGTQLKEGIKNASERPDRIEVITLSLTTQDLRQSHTSLRIVRGDDGKFKEWGKEPELQSLYDPESRVHPLVEGDFLPHGLIKGYIIARSKGRV